MESRRRANTLSIGSFSGGIKLLLGRPQSLVLDTKSVNVQSTVTSFLEATHVLASKPNEDAGPLMAAMDRSKIVGLVKREWTNNASTNALPETGRTSLSDAFSSLQRQPKAALGEEFPPTTPSPPNIFKPSPTSLNPIIHMRQVNHPLISSKPDLQAAMCASLFKFGLHDSLFSDVAVKILGTSYNLHRVILCANDFLMAKLAAMEDADLSHGTLEIKIFDPNVSDEAVQIVLRRLYGDFTDQVTNDNLLAVLASSYIFQDKDLHVMCHNFIRDIEFTPSNSLGFLDYASHYDHGLPTALLLRNTLIYLCREGSTSKKLRQKTFVKMDFAWFTKIVQSDAFYVASEFERFSFIMEVLKNRFPNFSDYTGAVQSMNTNVLSLGKLTQISNSSVKSRRASDRLSGASFGSLANDRANQRQSLYSEGSYESPKTKRISSFTESPYDETSRNKRVSMFESPTSASVSFAHEFATTSSPKSQRLARHSMTVDTSVADNFSVGLHGSPLSAPVSQRTGKPSVQVDMNVIAIEHIPLTSSAARKTSFANGVEQTPKPILRNSYTDNRGHYLADNRKIRRKSMLDPPTREEFFAQHAAALMMTPDQYALMSRSSGNALTSLATISGFPDMIRTGSLPATVRMKESRKSGMMRYFNDPNASFSSNDVTTNASAPPSTAAGGMAGSVPDTVESAVSLISRGLTYVHMSPEELLEYDLQVKVTELKLSKKSIDNPSPILVKTKYHPRSFLSWMLDEPVFPYDGMECPPARFSTEFSGASLGKFLKGSSEKLFSEVCFLAGSLWFLKVESSNSNVVISFGRKHSPHAPYSDMRPEVNFWCRVVCYVAINSGVKDAYTFEVQNGICQLTATTPISGGGYTTELYNELVHCYSTQPTTASLRCAVVFGLL